MTIREGKKTKLEIDVALGGTNDYAADTQS